jgi:hypothetical protein
VGHGLIFRHTDAGDVLPFRTRAREIFNVGSSSWPAKRRVAVHFAPAEPLTPGTRVARPDLREDIAEGVSREDFILGYFRDDNGVEALEQVARRGHRVLLFGQPRSVPRGVEVLPLNMSSFSEALGRCRAVIGSAGNHLPAECAMLGIPMLALHRTDDAEHAMNARLVEAAGIGIGSSFERCTLEVIRRFEAEFDKPREYLAARTRAMPPASQVVPQAIDELCRPATSRSSYGEVAGSWK